MRTLKPTHKPLDQDEPDETGWGEAAPLDRVEKNALLHLKWTLAAEIFTPLLKQEIPAMHVGPFSWSGKDFLSAHPLADDTRFENAARWSGRFSGTLYSRHSDLADRFFTFSVTNDPYQLALAFSVEAVCGKQTFSFSDSVVLGEKKKSFKKSKKEKKRNLVCRATLFDAATRLITPRAFRKTVRPAILRVLMASFEQEGALLTEQKQKIACRTPVPAGAKRIEARRAFAVSRALMELI